MGKDYGEPLRYDPEFSGPVHNRSCTDILWLLLFILFIAGWVFVGIYGIKNGDVQRLLAPMDTKGRKCGLDSDVANKPYLIFFDITRCLSPQVPITGCPTEQVCVEKCPDQSILLEQQLKSDPSNWVKLRSSMVCTYDIDVQSLTVEQALNLISQEKCASYVLQSKPVLSRCIGDLSTLSCKGKQQPSTIWPTIDLDFKSKHLKSLGEEVCVRDPKQAQSKLMNRATALDTYVGLIVASWVSFFTRNDRGVQDLSTQVVEDLVQSRWYLLGALLAVVLLCFLYIVLLRWVVAPVVWLSIAGLIALLCFTLYLCWKNFVYYRDNPVTVSQTTNLQGYAQSIFFKKETWMVLLILLAIIVIILVLMVVFLRARIVIAIALIREGSKAVGDIKSTIAFPLFPWALQCGIIAFGVVVLMYLLSIGESTFRVVNKENDTDCHCTTPIKEYDVCDPMNFATICRSIKTGRSCHMASCHFIGIDNPTYINYMHIVNIVGFFWAMFFIQGISDMMLASTFSTWYWTFQKRNLPFFTLTSGIYRTIRYHMGTVALGALIITIVRVIRLLLEYIDHKLKKWDNAFTKCVLCCCKCCFYCLENFLKFINKNAYIICAVHGTSFCKSARDAFSLLMRNILRVYVLDKVTDFIFFLSKLLISIGVGIAVYYILEWSYVYEVTGAARLHFNYVPATILALATYLITTLFFNVYAMAVDTLFICFLEDCERNDGSLEKPYFMSKNLMRILGKRNKH